MIIPTTTTTTKQKIEKDKIAIAADEIPSAAYLFALSIKRRKFFERKETVPALACDFKREVFLLYVS